VPSDRPWAPFFAYDPARRGQVEFADAVYEAVKGGRSVVINAPSGFGKTAACLAALLPFVKEGRRLIWAARTHREAERVIEELKLINAKKSVSVNAVAVMGRSEMCPLIPPSEFSSDEAAFYCREVRAACKYYKHFLSFSAPAEWCMTGGEVYKYALSREACPYFVQRTLTRLSQLVALSYQLALQGLHTYFKEVELNSAIMVFDEVHNLPQLMREAGSAQLTTKSVEQALREAEGKPVLTGFLEGLLGLLEGYGEERVEDAAGFTAKLKSLSPLPLVELINVMRFEGEVVRKALMLQGKRPRSSLSHVASFLKLVVEGLRGYALVVAGRSVKLLRLELPRPQSAFIGFSGTADAVLSEELHAEYVNLDSIAARPSARVFVLTDVSTTFEERSGDMYKRYVEWLKLMPERTGVFCASFDVLKGLLEAGVEKELTPMFIEREGMSSRENEMLIRRFKEQGGFYVGVCGGRASEGVDYPQGLMRAVYIVGVPFEEPSPSLNALINYYKWEHYFGDEHKAKLTAYVMPALRKAAQAAGRPFRSPEDKGIVVLGDKRFTALKRYLPAWLRSFKTVNYEERYALTKAIEETLNVKSL